MKSNLTIKVKEQSKNLSVIAFQGEFDKAGHSEVRSDLDRIVSDFQKDFLILDFTNLNFINSEGIGYLMEIHSFLKNKNKNLIIVGPNEYLMDIFQAIGLMQLIPVYKNIEDFLKHSK